MLPTEAQLTKWLLENWPSVVIGCSVALIYIAAFLRLHAFLQRVKKTEDSLVQLQSDFLHLESLVFMMATSHCQKYPLEMKDIMTKMVPAPRKETSDGKS